MREPELLTHVLISTSLQKWKLIDCVEPFFPPVPFFPFLFLSTLVCCCKIYVAINV